MSGLRADLAANNSPQELLRQWRRNVRRLHRVGAWRYSRLAHEADPRQGWKIHVSATVLSAGVVFARALPVLRSRGAFFKVPADLALLAYLNSGSGGYSQIGKFITVYPASAAEAVVLARDLDVATRGLPAPSIASDRQYRRGSAVYYRYGAFAPGLNGTTSRIRDQQGKFHPDRRRPGDAVPRWQVDPFNRSPRSVTKQSGPIGLDYLLLRCVARRGKGEVFEAVDIASSPARLVIIKQGRRHGDTDWNGDDGFSRVKREGRTLAALAAAGVPVPRVLRRFTHDRSAYLVLEKCAGRALLPRQRQQPAKASWRRAAMVLARLAPILDQLHRAGWVWRDCKPSHIFLYRAAIHLIDFEGACRTDDCDVLPWGTPQYLPPACREPFTLRAAGFAEDDYALGVIVFQLGTGKFPEPSARARAATYHGARCPAILRRRIEQLLNLQRSQKG